MSGRLMSESVKRVEVSETEVKVVSIGNEARIAGATSRDGFELRPISEWAVELALDSDTLVLAGVSCGKWWFGSSATPVYRRDIDDVEAFLRSAGLVAVLHRGEGEFSTEDGSTSIHRPSREADVERIVRLITENEAALVGRKWKWLVGDVLRLIVESKASMRVVRERGILLADVEEAIRRCPRFAAVMPTEGLTPARVVGEMKRLHFMRTGFLWLNQDDQERPFISCLDRRAHEPLSHAREFCPARFAVGEIVWVAIEEVTNGRKSRRKHPGLLLSMTGHRNDKWMVLSLTSEVDGDPQHRRVPQPARLGLVKGGYVWHEVQKVHVAQIESHVGWVTRGLVKVADATVNLRQAQIEELNAVADAHHDNEMELMFA